MIIYLASGFSVINVKGREEELCNKLTKKYGSWNRLISFYDIILDRNNVLVVLNLKKED